MGVSLYVMPLTRYLTGAFKTTWERRTELAGGAPGFLVTPQGVLAGPPERPRLDPDAARRYLEALRIPDENESGEALAAVTMSFSSLGDVVEAAGRYGVDRDLGLVAALGDVFFWLPSDLEGVREAANPFDADSVVPVASVPRLARQLEALDACLARDPRQEELESLPDGAVLTGALCDFHERRWTVGTLLRLARQATEHRLPLIVES